MPSSAPRSTRGPSKAANDLIGATQRVQPSEVVIVEQVTRAVDAWVNREHHEIEASRPSDTSDSSMHIASPTRPRAQVNEHRRH
eukprot:3538047-Lingulodinium_polyedra.AAC.2